MKEFPLLKTFDAYLRHFKLQFVKANPNKKHNAIYFTFHRIGSSISISEICKNSEVMALLSKQNMRLIIHLWKEDKTQIVNLGFYAKVDPSNVRILRRTHSHENLSEYSSRQKRRFLNSTVASHHHS